MQIRISCEDYKNKKRVASFAFSAIPDTGVKKLVDDILIFGEDLKTIMERTRLILTRCRENSITLSKKKIEFGKEVKFAGFIVSDKGVKPDPDKLKVIREGRLLQTQKHGMPQ